MGGGKSMKTTSIAVLVTLAGMLGCSTPQPAEPAKAAAAAQTESSLVPPSIVEQLQKLQPQLAPRSDDGLPEVFKGKPCLLGESCLAMDPRPFEICLLGANKRCGDKMAEPMQVDHAGEGKR
jgi:hypothetical protein